MPPAFEQNEASGLLNLLRAPREKRNVAALLVIFRP